MFIPSTTKDKEEMLKAIGVSSVKELLKQIPSKYLYPRIDLPETGLDEQQVSKRMRELAAKNSPTLSFVGAGAYERYTPSAVKALISRGEFLTAYTPYQAEASQGILQAIYEYQSSVAALYGMDCANASMYDGASAFGEAVRAAVRVSGKKKILCQETLNPEYLRTLKTYFANSKEYQFVTVPHKDGVMDMEKLNALLPDAACLAFQSPNFFGLIENCSEAAEAARKAGALVVTAADPLSLGLLTPPGEYGADFAIGEGQSLGLPLNYGGPYLGIFTCKKEHVRQMPGRIAGMTKDKDGKRGFVLTLQAREQHIRRDKAASNICSNEALCALAATIYLALVGPEGLKELARINADTASMAAARLGSLKGASLKFKGAFFNEFVLNLPTDAGKVREAVLKKERIDIGLPLKQLYPSLGPGALLVCATETKTEADIAKLEKALRENL